MEGNGKLLFNEHRVWVKQDGKILYTSIQWCAHMIKKNCTEYLKVWEGILLSDAFNNNSTKIQQDKNKQ